MLLLHKANKLDVSLYERLLPTGSQRPRLYGLPKVHKTGAPLRPILAMTGAAQHKLAQWLITVLQPVVDKYSGNCIKDSFSFADEIRKLECSGEMTMCSFDIKSLFTNVPVFETIGICERALFDLKLNTTLLEREDFVQLMKLATCNVEFSFDNMMYRQTEGVAMGSPLGPILANIFVGYHENQLFATCERPLVYWRYVDDTFAVFDDQVRRSEFEVHLNSLHPSLKFTSEDEQDNTLPFLDVEVHKSDDGFLTKVYRKPTFTGEYTKWRSFCDTKRKMNLVKTLTYRALKLCSPLFLEAEVDKIKSIFRDNGYPERLVTTTIQRKIEDFQSNNPPTEAPEKCPVYLRLPYIGPVSEHYRKKISSTIAGCYPKVKPRVILTSKPMLPSSIKDVLPTHQRSNLIYKFQCSCDSTYVGRTNQRLETRIRQHIPRWFEKDISSGELVPRSPSSAIAEHLAKDVKCGKAYNSQMFSIICHGRSPFHLQALEALNISVQRPPLCKQKKFVYSMLLFKHLSTGL